MAGEDRRGGAFRGPAGLARRVAGERGLQPVDKLGLRRVDLLSRGARVEPLAPVYFREGEPPPRAARPLGAHDVALDPARIGLPLPRPGAQVAIPPERSARVGEEDLEVSPGPAEQEQTRAYVRTLGHPSKGRGRRRRAQRAGPRSRGTRLPSRRW